MTDSHSAAQPKRASGRRFGKADLRHVGQVLRDQRVAMGLSLRVLSERCGISIAAIRALEAGQSNPSLGTVVPVIEVLGVKLDRVIEVARAARGRVVVTRTREGDVNLSDGLSDAGLSANILSMPVKSMRPSPPGAASHPSFGIVLEGTVLANVEPDDGLADQSRRGRRVKLVTGDNYHAQPGVVKTLANGSAREARVLVVMDTRSHGDPVKP